MNKQNFFFLNTDNLVVYIECDNDKVITHLFYDSNSKQWLRLYTCNSTYVKNDINDICQIVKYVYGI